jgi:hypothetical protein
MREHLLERVAEELLRTYKENPAFLGGIELTQEEAEKLARDIKERGIGWYFDNYAYASMFAYVGKDGRLKINGIPSSNIYGDSYYFDELIEALNNAADLGKIKEELRAELQDLLVNMCDYLPDADESVIREALEDFRRAAESIQDGEARKMLLEAADMLEKEAGLDKTAEKSVPADRTGKETGKGNDRDFGPSL